MKLRRFRLHNIRPFGDIELDLENLKIAVDEAEAILKAVGDNSSNARDIAVLAKLSKTNWRDVLDLVLRFEHKAS